jgi:sulfite dehydrogenase (quinone) subunit SoeB
MTQMALVIDLNVCVGCQACVTSCKEWNTSGESGSLADFNPYDADPSGTFFNRVQTFEAGSFPDAETIHFPKSCLHCEDPPCVPVCPTGASYKRKEDGLVLVDFDRCIGCKYCAWACPYGARELDEARREMTKCTLCVDRIHDEHLSERDRQPACVLACPTSARLFGDIHDPESVVSKAIEERGGYQLMPEWNTRPANHYLPRIPTTSAVGCGSDACTCGTANAAFDEPASEAASEPASEAASEPANEPASEPANEPSSPEQQMERGELRLVSMATRMERITR